MLGIAAGVVLAIYGGVPWWVNIILVCAVLLVVELRLAASVLLITVHAIAIGAVVAANVRFVPEWDFRVFWLHAQLAARGYDFYDRNLVRGFLTTMHASPRMIELGRFWNPPQAMVLLLPLGYVNDLHAAYAMWYAVQIMALAGCLFLLWREFGAPVIPVVALTLALQPTLANFVVGQTHFVVLLLILLAWRARRSPLGGVWLALAVVLKPVVLIVILEPVVRRSWRMLAGFATALLALTAVSFALFGFELNVRFYSAGAGEVPRAMLTQPPNRSLLASVLRSGFPEWTFIVAALLVLAATAMVVWRDGKGWMSLASMLAAGLLLYPHTLDHYAVLLIVPIVALWRTSTAGAVVAGVIHALAGPIPGLFDFPNLVLASIVVVTFCSVTASRARVVIITAA